MSNNAKVSFFGFDQTPKGSVQGNIQTIKETDDEIEVYVNLDDGRFIEIHINRKRPKVKPLTAEERSAVEKDLQQAREGKFADSPPDLDADAKLIDNEE